MAVHDLTCRQIVELVTDFVESSLDPKERDLFERHLAMCTWCQSYMEQMRGSIAVTAQVRENDTRPQLDSLLQAFRARHGPASAG